MKPSKCISNSGNDQRIVELVQAHALV